jgi:hypothetical protein
MSRHREKADEIAAVIDTPTEFPTEWNKYGINCEVCGGLFYVDERTYERVRSAVEFDPSDIPFRCDDCQEGYDEDAVY